MFVCKYNAHRSKKVTSKAPNPSLQVCDAWAFYRDSEIVPTYNQRKNENSVAIAKVAILKTAWRGNCDGDRHSRSGRFLA